MVKLAIIVSDFNKELTSVMEKAAVEYAKEKNIHVEKIIHVFGVFDMPLAVKRIVEKVDAVIVLGVVIQGETDHDLVIAHSTAQKCADLSLDHNKPIGLGIIGPKVTRAQAEKRTKEYAKRAIDAVIHS